LFLIKFTIYDAPSGEQIVTKAWTYQRDSNLAGSRSKDTKQKVKGHQARGHRIQRLGIISTKIK